MSQRVTLYHPLMSRRLTSVRFGAEQVTIQFSQDRMTATLVAVKCDDASNKRPVSWAEELRLTSSKNRVFWKLTNPVGFLPKRTAEMLHI
jgi:hypothetical protein